MVDFVSSDAAFGTVYATLIFFLGASLIVGYKFLFANGAAKDIENYTAARDSQGIVALSLSFFASGAGAWVLFTVPEASIVGGPIALFGYTISTLVPVALFAWIGPYMRANLPRGYTFFEYLQGRYGTLVNAYCTLVSLLYLCLYLTAEFSAVGTAILAMSNPADIYAATGGLTDEGKRLKVGVVLGVSVVTVLYTAIGGLPVSLVTDKVQGVGVILFTFLVCIATFGENTDFSSLNDDSMQAKRWETVTTTGTGDSSPTGAGDGNYGNAVKMAVILISAVTCANMMHSGFQQRVWAAEDNSTLRKGALGGILLTIPLMLLMGVVGFVSYAANGPFVFPQFPSFACFYALNGMPIGWRICAIILTVMMVASSADTIQTGVVALVKPFTTYVLVDDWKVITSAAEAPRTVAAINFVLAALLINLPAIIISTDDSDASLSVLSLFVLADLVCATCVVPVLMGLDDRIHPVAAFVGCLFGAFCLLLIYAVGVDDEPDNYLTMLPEIPGVSGLYATTSLVAFIVTPIASGIATLVANIPWFKSGYRFAGFSKEIVEMKATEASKA